MCKTEEKKMMKKKEKKKGAGRCNNLYHDTELGRLAWAQGIGHDMAGWATIHPTTRPRNATTRLTARARPGWG